jgi:hypothetical protein
LQPEHRNNRICEKNRPPQKLRLYTVQNDSTLTFVDILQQSSTREVLHWIDRLPTTSDRHLNILRRTGWNDRHRSLPIDYLLGSYYVRHTEAGSTKLLLAIDLLLNHHRIPIRRVSGAYFPETFWNRINILYRGSTLPQRDATLNQTEIATATLQL